MNRKKICFIVSSPSSARWFFKDHMERLSVDYDVFLVANFTNPQKELEGFVLNGYKNIQIERKLAFKKDIKSIYELYRYFRSQKFDVVHAMASKPSVLSAIAAFCARIPIRIRIFTGQLWCEMRGLKRCLFKTIDRITVLLNTISMADGHSQMAYLEQQGIIKKNKGIVLAKGSICGVDIARFTFSEGIRSKYRNKLNFDNKLVYIFVGRHKTEKGVNELFAAFNSLFARHRDTILLLVGTDEENCRSRIVNYPNLKDGSNVIFYGPTRTPEHLLMASDVFCLSSYREGFGLSVLEASCVGLPVICSDVYGMQDTMVDNVTGLRCKVKDSKSLEGCMEKLYLDKDLRKTYGQNGHKMVVNDFSKKYVTEEWISFYNVLLE
ncbi:glycosyltransferase [uncultured Bacteroides sp.]|uniref:glycosyltransferase n=1 Tax=uncultured Bacteroides sp. TaxID=162156 RepID=UPI0025EA8394|nr:glycosyltransferase [uncultured Bacteroides sp.]